jgi:hypothetical protein
VAVFSNEVMNFKFPKKGWEFLDQLRDFIHCMYDSPPFSKGGEAEDESERIFVFYVELAVWWKNN